jgi:hypothetical protein
MANKTTFDFEANIDGALEDDQLRKNLRKAMDILVDKRRAVFPDAAYARTTAVGRQCHQAPRAATAAPAAGAARSQLHPKRDPGALGRRHGPGQRHRARHPAPPRCAGHRQGQVDGLRGDAPEPFSRRKRYRGHRDRSGRIHHPAQPRDTLAHHRACHSQEQGRSGRHFHEKIADTPTPKTWKN